MSARNELILGSTDQLLQATTRRRFLGMLGVASSVVLLPGMFAACNSNDVTGLGRQDPNDPANFVLDLSTDTGILNYAYALEQLEGAFYTAAIASPGFAQLSAAEQEVVLDVQGHEVIHVEFFKRVLGTDAIPALAFDATTVASLMANATVLLSTAQLLEDTGVSAYNGAGKHLANPANLLVAGKIVSVEARHAAAFRDIRDIRAGGANLGRAFAGDDVVNVQGLDVKAEPGSVLASVVSLNVVTSPLGIGSGPNGTATADQKAPTPT
ncbi:MAG: Tat (twin-arginine translocation) pathway signal sequence containing protein [Gemmatimonadetes bacterium]|jgi:hypothetical protein|nr:Tat (twin-arginine translocation) pathway signal sequence containing protein [Gemmatimonadota bacterium]